MTIELVEHNPQLKKPVARMLSLAEELAPCDRRDLEKRAAETWDESFAQAPGVVADMLVRAGAFIERTFVAGEPYDGTLEDIQLDESIPLDADVEVRLALTDEGRALSREIDPSHMVAALLSGKPHYAHVFSRVIGVCSQGEGASRADVEAAVEAAGKVRSPKGDRVYPQYFIDALESAGAIEWDGLWRATDVGVAALS